MICCKLDFASWRLHKCSIFRHLWDKTYWVVTWSRNASEWCFPCWHLRVSILSLAPVGKRVTTCNPACRTPCCGQSLRKQGLRRGSKINIERDRFESVKPSSAFYAELQFYTIHLARHTPGAASCRFSRGKAWVSTRLHCVSL